MMSAVASPTWPARVIALSTSTIDVTRGRASEFRQRGLVIERTSSVSEALISIGHDPESIVLVPTDLAGMPVLDFIDVVRAFSASPVIVGLVPECDDETIAAALDRGLARTVRLPVTAIALARAVEEAGHRVTRPDPERFRIGALELDAGSYRVHWHGVEVHVPPRQFELLRYFAAAHPRMLTIEELVSEFGANNNPRDRAERVRVMIARLRALFTQAVPDQPAPLETVHRVGYRLAD
jgi:DNA-binding response OmpR family regulator